MHSATSYSQEINQYSFFFQEERFFDQLNRLFNE